jgi:radical SAM superfamily enzyme YgiQ (UPF0313 family)
MDNADNRFKKVLLFTLPVNKRDVQIPLSPYCGMGYIAESLSRNKIAYRYLDLRFGDINKKFIELVNIEKPDLIATTMFTLGYKYAYSFLEKVKSALPQVKIAVGGPHVSTFREEMLEGCCAIDYGVSLEGDETIIELCAGKPQEAIKGLIYRANGQVKYTGDREFITDLDRLGFPLYKGFDLERYAVKSMSISSSRGCFAHCTFCAVDCTHGRKIRLKSAALVAEEISYWYNRGYHIISIVDDNFPVNRKRVMDICEILQSKRLKNLQIKFDNGVRADCVGEELLRAMFRIGVNKISFGVESANEHILKNIKKGETLEEIQNAIRLALKVGMQVHATFIIGLPGESQEDVRRSFDFAKRVGIHNAVFNSLIPFPKTELFAWAKELSYLLYKPEDYLNFIVDPGREATVLLETPELSRSSREKLHAEGKEVTRLIERKQQVKLLESKVGRFLARLIILIYTNKYFERFFDHSFWLKKYVFKLRMLLRV